MPEGWWTVSAAPASALSHLIELRLLLLLMEEARRALGDPGSLLGGAATGTVVPDGAADEILRILLGPAPTPLRSLPAAAAARRSATKTGDLSPLPVESNNGLNLLPGILKQGNDLKVKMFHIPNTEKDRLLDLVGLLDAAVKSLTTTAAPEDEEVALEFVCCCCFLALSKLSRSPWVSLPALPLQSSSASMRSSSVDWLSLGLLGTEPVLPLVSSSSLMLIFSTLVTILVNWEEREDEPPDLLSEAFCCCCCCCC